MTLENLLGISNAAEFATIEEQTSKRAAIALWESGALDALQPGSFQALAAIHRALFEQLYDFAGEIRQVNISKGAFRFAPALYLHDAQAAVEAMPQSTFEEYVAK